MTHSKRFTLVIGVVIIFYLAEENLKHLKAYITFWWFELRFPDALFSLLSLVFYCTSPPTGRGEEHSKSLVSLLGVFDMQTGRIA